MRGPDQIVGPPQSSEMGVDLTMPPSALPASSEAIEQVATLDGREDRAAGMMNTVDRRAAARSPGHMPWIAAKQLVGSLTRQHRFYMTRRELTDGIGMNRERFVDPRVRRSAYLG